MIPQKVSLFSFVLKIQFFFLFLKFIVFFVILKAVRLRALFLFLTVKNLVRQYALLALETYAYRMLDMIGKKAGVNYF